MRHRWRFFVILCSLALAACASTAKQTERGLPLVHAGFDEGKAAYDKGDYVNAYKEFKLLADQGATNR